MKLQSFAKYIDQPLMINKIQRMFPATLVGLGTVADVYMALNSSPEKRKENTIKNTIILASVVSASLIGARGLKIKNKQILKGLMPLKERQAVVTERNFAIQKFINEEEGLSDDIKNIFKNSAGRALKINEIETLTKKLPNNKNRKELFDVLFEPAAELTSKGIFEDMKRLPQYGAYAIGGGLAGGLVADKITGTSSKKNTANKIKEAVYQYFANTFLCITGAGVSLAGLEQLAKKGIVKNVTPAKKLTAVIGGIAGVGVVFGSIFANEIGKKIINPLFNQKESSENKKRIYSERHPELLDVCIHVDDLATAGVYSGFKWLESVMPIFYLLAGYRAGTGHRNAKKTAVQKTDFAEFNKTQAVPAAYANFYFKSKNNCL